MLADAALIEWVGGRCREQGGLIVAHLVAYSIMLVTAREAASASKVMSCVSWPENSLSRCVVHAALHLYL